MEDSDNVRGAENQQERLWIHGWIAGFVDTEGCFSCPLYRNPKTGLGWQLQPLFVVVQGKSSRSVLEDLVRFFGCGKVGVNHRHDNHRESLSRYYVGRCTHLRDIIVPYFGTILCEHRNATTSRSPQRSFVSWRSESTSRCREWQTLPPSSRQ